MEAATEVWKRGDSGYYVLPPSKTHKRPSTLYLAVVVTRVNGEVITVRPINGHSGHKVTRSKYLARTAPDGAWVK